MIKIGLCASALSRDMSYDEVVDWAGAKGFETLEIPVRSSAFARGWEMLDVTDLLAGGKQALERYTEPLKRNQIPIGSLFYFGLNNLDADIEVRRKVQQGLRESILAAALLGAGVIVTAAGSPHGKAHGSVPNARGGFNMGYPNAEGDRLMKEGIEVFAENYLPLADLAQEHGVKIAFEPSALGGGHGAVAHSPETFDALFAVANHPALGINFDPSHLLWQGIDVVSYAAQLAKEGRIFSCHGKDTEVVWSRLKYVGVMGEGWWRHRLPGWGPTSWVDLIKVLLDAGFDAGINIEHEDRFFGHAGGQKGDLALMQEGYVLSLQYLKHARRIASL